MSARSTSSVHNGRPTLASIDAGALTWNLRQIRARVGAAVKILAMVKANAYGHGAARVADILGSAGADGFGVATVEEAIELRRAGIQQPILVVGGVYTEQLGEIIEYALTPVIYDAATLVRFDDAASARGAALDIHVKIDSGMGRIGFLPAEIDDWLPRLKALRALKIAGVLSHFSHADNVVGDYTQSQLEIFSQTVARLRTADIHPDLAHMANSAATITLPPAYFDMVRPGLMLYGAYPSPHMAEQICLKPALTWASAIMQVKEVPAGTSISYGQTFVTRRKSVIATVPVGYADGYSRLNSNRGAMLVRGRRAPIAGRVCMDLTMIDVTDIAKVRYGDEVVLLGRQSNEEITADEMAAWSGTISYEIFTSIGSRVPRVYYQSKEDD